MPKKGKGKKKEDAEPPHREVWELAVSGKSWEYPPDELPNALAWPTWGALRERVLTSVETLSIDAWTVPASTRPPDCRLPDDWRPPEVVEAWAQRLEDGVDDAFAAEVVRLSPPLLRTLRLSGCPSLTVLELSPLGCLPALEILDLSRNRGLRRVLIQSDTVTEINLSLCPHLRKALLHCRAMAKLDLRESLALENLRVWSGALDVVDIPDCKRVDVLDLHCPLLHTCRVGRLRPKERAQDLRHAPIALALAEAGAREHAAGLADRKWLHDAATSRAAVPKTRATM